MQQNFELQSLVDTMQRACGVVYLDDQSELQTVSNLPPLELATLLEQAAGILRKRNDPEHTELR